MSRERTNVLFASPRLPATAAGPAIRDGLGEFAHQDFSRRDGGHFAPHLVYRRGDVFEHAPVASTSAPTPTRPQEEARKLNWVGATPHVQERSDDVSDARP